MNRFTALLLAMAALLLHGLAIYRNPDGRFGEPFDSAHVVFALARNAVHHGEIAWNAATGAGGLASYPSPLWIGVAWVAERLWLPVTTFTQLVGIGATLLAVAVSTRFDTDRIVGVVPAVLLVTSGAVAGAGPSGTEWGVAALFLVTAFVALEHGRSRVAAIALAGLVLTRPEGVLAAAVLLVQTLARRRTSWPFLPAAGATAWALFGGPRFDAALADVCTPDRARLVEGLLYARDHVVATATPLLVLVPLVALVLRELSGVGRRALALSAAWFAVVVAEGGGAHPYGMALLPALPPLFIAVQQGIARALDTFRPWVERAAWLLLLLAAAASLAGSRFGGTVGGLDLTGLHEEWQRAAAPPPAGRPPTIARSSLHAEIKLAADLRRVGGAVRDVLPPDASLLTPWPGAIGYLSDARVIDLFGRTTPLPGEPPGRWWPHRPRADWRAALDTRPDFVLPGFARAATLAGEDTVGPLPAWLVALDPDDGPALRADLERRLAAYELVVVPSSPLGVGPRAGSRALFLLRRSDGAARPALDLRVDDGALRVDARLEGDAAVAQLVQLRVLVHGPDGRPLSVRPDGTVSDRHGVYARAITDLRPHPEHPTTLVTLPLPTLPDGGAPVAVEAQLFHAGMPVRHPLGPASESVRAAL